MLATRGEIVVMILARAKCGNLKESNNRLAVSGDSFTGSILNLNHWDLFVVWDLLFGIYYLGFAVDHIS